MNKVSRFFAMTCVLIMLFVVLIPAEAATSNKDKQDKYNNAVEQLETYLESINDDDKLSNLDDIIDAFNELGNFSFSQALKFYVMALQKIEMDEYDFMLGVYIESMEKNTRFIEYLSSLESPIYTVEEFKHYMEGRKAEFEGRDSDASAAYDLCNGYYDSAVRQMALGDEMVVILYQKGMELLAAGDMDGAYEVLNEIRGYGDTNAYLEVIEARKSRTWSEWADELPEGIDESKYEVETQLLYRTAEKETTTSSSKTMAGWELYDSSTRNNGYTAWSSWEASKPSQAEGREVDSKTQYRYRILETTTSTSSSKSGWELYDQDTSWGSYGSWSDWSKDAVSQSDSRQVEEKTQYSYRDKKYTTASTSTLDGWKLYDQKTSSGDYGSWSSWSTTSVTSSSTRQVETKEQYSYRTVSSYAAYTDWSSWSGWSTTAVSASDTMEVETKKQYGYYYWTCPNCGNHWHGFGFTCASWGGGCGKVNLTSENTKKTTVWGDTPQSQISWKDWHGTGAVYTTYNGERVFRFPSDPNKSRTVYRYRTRELTTVYDYSDWTSYSDSYPSYYADIRSRTVYRYRDKAEVTTYYFYKWGSWSSYSFDKGSGDDERTRTVYRYRDRERNKKYYFKRWGEWSSWQDGKISETSEKEVDSRTLYRYRDIAKEEKYYFFRWKEWTDWTVAETAPEKTDDLKVETRKQYRYR